MRAIGRDYRQDIFSAQDGDSALFSISLYRHHVIRVMRIDSITHPCSTRVTYYDGHVLSFGRVTPISKSRLLD